MIKENNPREVGGVTDRETRLRGYRYSYDALGRLTETLYGENTDITSNPNRYTERVLEYTANGNVRRFQRHGLKDDGKYGKVDNLHLTYDGNQLVSVLDDAADVTRFASADFPDLSDSSKEYTYDECGALTSDLNHGISSISYDDLGNPRQTRFKSGATTLYVYTPDGRKVREIHNRIETIDRPSLGAVLGKTVSDTTDYIGPVIYEGRRASTVRFEGGYASFSPLAIAGSKPAPTFHYYIPDYLGNNRVVVNAATGVMEQITHYYPWGGVYADLGTGAAVQPFKYGDKELDLSNGIARYDYTARAYVPATLRFDRIDLYAGDYPHISPYAFCANNPVNVTDPSGNRIVTMIDDEEWEFMNGEDGYGFYRNGERYAGNAGHVYHIEAGLNKLLEGAVGSDLVNTIIDSTESISIVPTYEDGVGSLYRDGTEKKVIWNVRKPMTGSSDNETSFITLGHELAHAYDDLNGTIDNNIWATVVKPPLKVIEIYRSELFAGNVENHLRLEHGLPYRPAYYTHDNVYIEPAYTHENVFFQPTRYVGPDWHNRIIFPKLK
ncbi:MAG: hypothetical protein K2G35_03950 [Duncaniella sp.]|nr:hypothetical protein [Duncaniella sp.]